MTSLSETSGNRSSRRSIRFYPRDFGVESTLAMGFCGSKKIRRGDPEVVMEKKHTFPLSLGQWKGGNIGCWTRRFVPLKYPCLHKHPPIHWPENTQILSKSSEKMQLAIVDLMGDATLVDLLGPFFTLPLPSIASEDL